MLTAAQVHTGLPARSATVCAVIPLRKRRNKNGSTHPGRAVPHTDCELRLSAAELVRVGNTPVGKGLVSNRNEVKSTRLLQVSLAEVLAVVKPDAQGSSALEALAAATTAYSAMPKQLLHFVQGTKETTA